MRKFLATFFLAFAVLAVLSGGANFANAAEKAGPVEPVVVKDNEPIVCHPDALTEKEKKIGMEAPCAPKNYIYVPCKGSQINTEHDRNNIWTDEEVKNSASGDPTIKASICECTIMVGAVEVMASSITPAMCSTPRDCPNKVRLRKPGKPDKIIDLGQVCPDYNYIRDDLKFLLTCGKHYPLD